MKIGQFARKYKVSVDTIRYYMELMLIIPEKSGGQYEFDESCENDLKEILWLKGADFSLNEIQRVFTLKRLTYLKSDEDIEYYRALFSNKREELLKRRNEIDEIIDRLDMKIRDTETKSPAQAIRLGVPLDFLSIFACPKCRGSLRLHRANIEDNSIQSGELKCSCGYEANIAEGIIVMKNNFKKSYEVSVELEGHFIEETSSDFVNLLYKSSQWIVNKIDMKSLNNKVVMEPGTGSGMLLSSILKDVPGECLYICVDHDIELLRRTKANVEKYYEKGSFIFIGCDFLDIPIKDSTVDLVIDHYGSSNYSFSNEGYLISLIDSKVKLGGKWIGNYLNFKPGSKSLLQYPEKNRRYFYLDNIKSALENSKFKALDSMDMGYTEKGGVYEKFFIEGDKLYDFVYYGEKVR